MSLPYSTRYTPGGIVHITTTAPQREPRQHERCNERTVFEGRSCQCILFEGHKNMHETGWYVNGSRQRRSWNVVVK